MIARNRRGLTLLHAQAAIAIGAILVSAVGISLSSLYRMQRKADLLREMSAATYRFERLFRQDAGVSDTVSLNAKGELEFRSSQALVRYRVDGRLVVREVQGDTTVTREVLHLVGDQEALLGADSEQRVARLRILAASRPITSEVLIESPFGRASQGHEPTGAGDE